MSWTYEQKTGVLRDKTGQAIAKGYAGHGEGVNNPAMQEVEKVGPLPRGVYTIGPPYDSEKTGPFTMTLNPAASNQMFGRGDFRMHGDSKEHPGTASEGCIIMPRTIREMVWNSNDRKLEVVEGNDVESKQLAVAA